MKGSSADQTLSIVTAKCYPSSAHIAVSVQISFTVSIIPAMFQTIPPTSMVIVVVVFSTVGGILQLIG